MQWIVRRPLLRRLQRPYRSDSSGEYKFDQVVYRNGPVKRIFLVVSSA